MAVNGTNFKQYNNMSNNIWICLMIFELSSHFTQSPIVHKLKNIWSVCEKYVVTDCLVLFIFNRENFKRIIPNWLWMSTKSPRQIWYDTQIMLRI